MCGRSPTASPRAEKRDIRTAKSTPALDNIKKVFGKLAATEGIIPESIHVASRPGTLINAASLGDRHFIVTDALMQMDNPCLLWGIVAHELAHDLLGHSNSKVLAQMGLGALATAAGAVSGGLGGYVVGAAGDVLINAYSRSQEREADAKAIDLLEKGGNPRWALRYTLEFLRDAYGDEGGGWTQSHPLTSERISTQPEVDPHQDKEVCGQNRSAQVAAAKEQMDRMKEERRKAIEEMQRVKQEQPR